MSAIGPTTVSFMLEAPGQQPVKFIELGEARSAIRNIKGVLAGATPQQSAQVVLLNGGSTADVTWLTLWQQNAVSNPDRGRLDFSVVAISQPGDKTIARFSATKGWPTNIVTDQGHLQKVVFACATLDVKYF